MHGVVAVVEISFLRSCSKRLSRLQRRLESHNRRTIRPSSGRLQPAGQVSWLFMSTIHAEFLHPAVTCRYAVAIVVGEDAVTGHIPREISKLFIIFRGMAALFMRKSRVEDNDLLLTWEWKSHADTSLQGHLEMWRSLANLNLN